MKLLPLFFACVFCGQAVVGSAEKLHNLGYYELVNVLADGLENVVRKDTETHPYKRRVKFSGHGRTFDVRLKRSNAIPKKLNVITQNHDEVGQSYHFRDHPVENCYYHGALGDEDDAPVIGSGSMCDEGFRGTLTHYDGENFVIRPLEADDKVEAEKRKTGTHVLYKSKDVLNKEDMPKKDTPKTSDKKAGEQKVKSNFTKIYGREDERWIEVIPVLTYEMFIQLNGDMEKVIKQVIAWIHETDGVYQSLEKKTRMVMVGLMVWDKFNEASPDIDTMPGYVQKVMAEKLGLRFDTIPVLIYGGGWWGLSWLRTVCGNRSASICSVSTYRSIGILIYHETLHALGMKEREMGQKVIKDNFNKMIDGNWFPCLYERVAKDLKKNTCGNGVKEVGEDCDCLNEYQCRKRGEFECCDPKTCRLRPNMQCMDGGCCDKCMFKKKGASCVSTDKCLSQSPSMCSGTTGQCISLSPALPAKKIGCYTLKYNAHTWTKHGLFNGAHRYHKSWSGHMKGVLCQCARAARESGREYFALTEHSKCYAVKKEDLVPHGDMVRNDAEMSNEVKVDGTPAVVLLSLMNAEQSSTHITAGCSGEGTCSADKAADGDMKTGSVTHVDYPSWWSAEISNRSKIHDIRITTNSWAFNSGFFDRLKVETAENKDGPWRTCKGEFKMTAPYVDHVIKCDNPTVANYIRVGLYGGKPLYLNEVKVRGYPFSGKLVKEPCNGIDDGCCTELSPCAENDGDCDTDNQCAGNLVCGTDNCPSKYPFGRYDDCCMKGECYLASENHKNRLICNKANYLDNNPEACTSAYPSIYFVYKVDIPNRCPTKKLNEIGRQLPIKRGCYHLKQTSSASLLIDNSVFYTPWHQSTKWHVLVKELLCECAEAAKKRGGKFIALQQSKCWMIDENDLGVESNDVLGSKKTWRNDGRCGASYTLPNGDNGECDPNASADQKGPCCSVHGWCGNSKAHCRCNGCTNYGAPKCYLADGWWTKKGWYYYKCDKKDLHSETSYPCVGSRYSNSYFVYQLYD